MRLVIINLSLGNELMFYGFKKKQKQVTVNLAMEPTRSAYVFHYLFD